MLTELRIENFAIIEQLELRFEAGLITFTGETGAGKSIIIDAVETLLGGRADATMVRAGAERASVEGVFQIPAQTRDAIEAILRREDLFDDPQLILLGREIRLEGRNIARVNGRSVNASLLREIGEYLVDIHGQSEHLSLLRVAQHQELLDRYTFTDPAISVGAVLEAYRANYQRLGAVRKELDELRQSEHEAARRMDMLRYQINEINAANLQIDEEDELRDERNRLANAAGLAKLVQESLLALDEGSPESPAATDLLGQVVHAQSSVVRMDPSQSKLLEQAEDLFARLSDLSGELRCYLENIEFNPRRLDQVEDRLALIHNLKHKYGDSIAEILEFAVKAQRDLEAITHAGERIAELESEQEKLLRQLYQEGSLLSEKRQAGALQLSRAIESELDDLNMSAARFQVDFQRHPHPDGVPLDDGQRVAFNINGLERIEFLIAPNPGEGFKPLTKIASGGETSRLMLALKNVLASADHVPMLIFDEIDQGIGGRVGTIVGEKLWSLAREHQVFCITHLPQLAAYGNQHFHVQKQILGGRTVTQVTALQGEARLVELAQMMGEVSEGTLHSARELTELVEQRTLNN